VLQVAIVNYTNVVQVGGSTDEERRKAAASAYDNFFDYLLRNAIFLPKSTAQQLDELRTVYVKSWNKFLHGVEYAHGEAERTTRWTEISDRVEKLSVTAIAELEDELRHLLGDEPIQRISLLMPV
jgi:hypothetical protein